MYMHGYNSHDKLIVMVASGNSYTQLGERVHQGYI